MRYFKKKSTYERNPYAPHLAIDLSWRDRIIDCVDDPNDQGRSFTIATLACMSCWMEQNGGVLDFSEMTDNEVSINLSVLYSAPLNRDHEILLNNSAHGFWHWENRKLIFDIYPKAREKGSQDGGRKTPYLGIYCRWRPAIFKSRRNKSEWIFPTVVLLCINSKSKNGGNIIKDARNKPFSWWTSRYSLTFEQQRERILNDSPYGFYHWEGDDLHLDLYPAELDLVSEQNRENGKRGGRPKGKAKSEGNDGAAAGNMEAEAANAESPTPAVTATATTPPPTPAATQPPTEHQQERDESPEEMKTRLKKLIASASTYGGKIRQAQKNGDVANGKKYLAIYKEKGQEIEILEAKLQIQENRYCRYMQEFITSYEQGRVWALPEFAVFCRMWPERRE